MPRFNAENVPNALQEQMWRQMLNQAMFDKEPTEGGIGLTEFNSNIPSNSVPTGPSEFVPQDWPIGPYSTVPTTGPMRDDPSRQQMRADRKRWEDAYMYSKPEALNPLHQNNPPANRDELGDFGGGNTEMNRMYNLMPPNIPRYPGMVMPAPDENQQMDQLMQFYTDENI